MVGRMKSFFRKRNQRCSRRRRSTRKRGAAIVEFAVVLPLLLTVLFGIIQYGWVFMIRQTLQMAAREGCRVAVLPTSVAPYTNVTTRINEVMSTTGLTTFTITMTHATLANPVESVLVSVPYADASLLAGWFGSSNFNLSGASSMRKEGMGG